MRIGIAGLGRMGAAIAERLVEVGHELTVWNRSPDKTKPLTDAGAAAADAARARPILEGLCRRIEHVGPVGAGASMKLAINLPLLVFYQALGEAYALCRHLDLDRAAMMDLFADTSGGPNLLKVRGPVIAKA